MALSVRSLNRCLMIGTHENYECSLGGGFVNLRDYGRLCYGREEIDMTDEVITLNGRHSILGRALVVHEGEDQFTQPSGDAGARVAFGVIGVATSEKLEEKKAIAAMTRSQSSFAPGKAWMIDLSRNTSIRASLTLFG